MMMGTSLQNQMIHFTPLVVLVLSIFSSVSESNQFCEAGIGYGNSECRVSSSSSSKILINGGTVVNAHHQEIADVYVEDGIIATVKPEIKVGDDVTVLDATGKFVMPGGIDPHTNLAMEFMGTETIDDYFGGQAATLAGGTMHIDFVILGALMVNDELLLEGLKKKCKSLGALAMVHAENYFGDAKCTTYGCHTKCPNC
ncbi:Dihydropyrimidinase [Camellia lanceoleosa]|uniref:Dihydropyrimidinase n=1 Tax=Camellia lanceoleosa TaxID=1840588 RepID=A0ACC0GFG2_9ERIC|nr:Dihydropyrimidinase [Camellia lanceoleosa]